MGSLGRIGWLAIGLVAGFALPARTAFAAMGVDAVIGGIHPKNKDKITLDEMRDAAGRTYDKIAKAYGGKVTLLQLGGRVTSADLEDAKIGVGERDGSVSRADYQALASRFFSQADVLRKPDVSPADGTLDRAELTTPTGEKLMRLIE